MNADVGTVLNAMRDPAGIPSHPVVFQVMMVLTWIFHIAFVHMTLGTAALAIVAFYKRRPGTHWEALSMAMTKAAKIGVSLLIVLGVAPLVFTQVIYDRQWYTANQSSRSGCSANTLSIKGCMANQPALDEPICLEVNSAVFASISIGSPAAAAIRYCSNARSMRRNQNTASSTD